MYLDDLDEYMRDYAIPQIERQIDDLIAGETDPEWRAALLRNRRRMIDKMIDVTMIASLRRQLEDAGVTELRSEGSLVH